ncbi:alpha/beta hydrolase [Chelativorans sp. Marseille-P2723]|uniref:alpha/beta fold hydrolase n=1 Tax=Chelativorans sp. Marseille-P2723 TaxID=2709133 RepID=UPI001FEDF55E|nr:alpha/beta hydrolase [Chelativorans sp. Marseille-P2723]
MAFDTATKLSTPTGACLQLYACQARQKARAVVQINHGLAEHAGRYGPFAGFLSERGFHVVAHDHRGHGHTVAPGAPMGSFGQGKAAASHVLEDVLAVHGHIAATYPGLPVILFGHSMGAMIALTFLARHFPPVAAAALWNVPITTIPTARAAKIVLSWERLRLGSDVPSRLMPLFTFHRWAESLPDARTQFDWISSDPVTIEKYIADPLCGWLPSIGMWNAIFDFNLAITRRQSFAAVDKTLPIQLAGGGADPSTGNGKSIKELEKRLRRKGFSNLETRIYPHIRHESLNEVNRTEVMDDFVLWAKQALRG